MSEEVTTQPRRPPGALDIGWRRLHIELLQFVRDREAAFFTLILPVLLLVSRFRRSVMMGR